jgi:regulator of sigma E protease
MTLLNLILHNFLSFVAILTFIVFIHEFGHYWVARMCGVRVEEFSIGFGKELFGFSDKAGTRWKFCLLPFGGYVRMFGDKNPASMPGEQVKLFSEAEKKVSFYFQNVYKRMAIVAAGPIANFLLAILILTVLFRIQGLNTILPIVDKVMEQSAASEAGIKSGDRILEISGQKINDFNEARMIIAQNGEKPLEVLIKRGEKQINFNITPKISVTKDFFGKEVKIGMVGIAAGQVEYKKLNLGNAFITAIQETYKLSAAILKALGELITGKRDVKELGGPVKIAEYSGKSVEMGMMTVLWFIAMISLNLGVMNLLPLPVLDGGHLLFYIFEAIRGKALPEKIQQYGFQFGMAILLSLMIFTTYNDISQIFLR